MKRLLSLLFIACLCAGVVAAVARADSTGSTQIDDPGDDVYPPWPHVWPWPDDTVGLSYLHDSVTATIPKYLLEDHSYLKCLAVTWWNELEENADIVPDDGILIWETGHTAAATDPQGDSPIPEGDLLSFSVWEPDLAHLSLRWRFAVPVQQVPAVVSPYAVLLPRSQASQQAHMDEIRYYVWLASAPSQEELHLYVMYDSAATASRVVHPAYDFCDIRRGHMQQNGGTLTARVTLAGDVPLAPPQDARGLGYFFAFAPTGDPGVQPFSYLSVSWDGGWRGEIGRFVGGRFHPVGSVPVSRDGKQLSVTGSILALGLPPSFAWAVATISVIGPVGDQYAASLDSAPDMGYVDMKLEPFPAWMVYLPIVVKS